MSKRFLKVQQNVQSFPPTEHNRSLVMFQNWSRTHFFSSATTSKDPSSIDQQLKKNNAGKPNFNKDPRATCITASVFGYMQSTKFQRYKLQMSRQTFVKVPQHKKSPITDHLSSRPAANNFDRVGGKQQRSLKI